MRQKVSSSIALICIAVYVLALGIAAYKIITGINERQRLAEREFAELVDISSAAGVLGFMNEPFREAIQDALMDSQTLQAVIISGPLGVDTFERERGRIITWVGESPRFKTAFGLSAEPFFMPLRLEGIRNTTISAVSNYIDHDGLIDILKYTLLAILVALAIAFSTLIMEFLQTKTEVAAKSSRKHEAGPTSEEDEAFEEEAVFHGEEFVAETEATPKAAAEEVPPEDPRGLYSPHGNIGWEDYIKDRLSSELHRCAASEQDLVFAIIEFKNPEKINEEVFIKLADEAVEYFIHRDLIFEKGNRGISVIIPNIDVDQGLTKSEIFHNQILQRLSPAFQKTDLCIGLSSRSGRLIDGERLIFEAEKALEKAMQEPVSSVVAFKSDPEKYRAFIASQNKKRP
ncbi:hypothetical protein LQZ21_01745 [Treponema sp. TIM-1]|uniref:hypothetical protein n=1 Tax=Treponema sp. TIM-1 TaxID=2898417 RepID=UPI00397F6998